MKKLIFAFYLFLLLSAFTCQKEKDSEAVPATSILIKTGASFGMCVGHCITKVEINPQQITMLRQSWRSQIADKTCNRAIMSQEWENLVKVLDFNTFVQLPETIGCPDCADGGAEWIEITYGEQRKKVTFEFGKEVAQISELLAQTRKIRESLKNCE
jgi:hypothetical protein